MSKNITQFLETQFPMGRQVGFYCATLRFHLFLMSKYWSSWFLRGLLWKKSKGRCPNVTYNPFFDFFPFRVALSSCKYP